jgi:hypothetical protein
MNEDNGALDASMLDQELYFLAQAVAAAAQDIGDDFGLRVDRVLPEAADYVNEMFKAADLAPPRPFAVAVARMVATAMIRQSDYDKQRVQ